MTYGAEDSVTYRVSQTVGRKRKGDLADRGANGGVKGDGLRTISKIPGLHVDLSGLDNHTLSKTPIGTCGGVVVTQRGPVLLIFHRYALLNRGRTIHSPIQFEAYGNQVDDKSLEFGGTQCIKTVDGYRIPLDIQDGLAYFNTRPFTDEEFEKLPHVVMTSNEPWRPSSFNSVISDDPTWYESQPDEPLPNADNFNAHGEFLHHVHETTEHPRDYDALRPFLLNAPREVVMHTMRATTQWYNSIPQGSRIYDMRSAHFPACNIFRRHEAVGTDTVFFDIEAWGGYRCCQFYIGRRSYYMSAHGMLTDGQFVGSLEDEIRYRGAMDLLISDMAKAEISARVREILRAFRIKDWQSEPHHQNQNIAERYIQELKKYCNWVLNTSGAPPEAIFFIIKYAMLV
ncbi:hypothetical protein ACHAWT_001041 [Skeletonema menzelii]